MAVTAILKDEGHYLREWLDYHILAGVEHFYLYDNDSSDDYAAIIAPYVAAGLVTSVKLSGGSAQYAAYNFAVREHRFQCRHMAFIDLDEFLYPKNTTGTITETLDGILEQFPQASGVAVNWQLYGSNGARTADYSRGVLERFTRRAPVDWVVPIPHRDMLPQSIEEQIVCYADKFFSKTKLEQEKTLQAAQHSLEKFGAEGAERFRHWAELFG